MDETIDSFLNKNSIEKIVGFSGGSDSKKEDVQQIVEDSIREMKDYPIAVLTGGTS